MTRDATLLPPRHTMIIGGGPAGTAVLLAASRSGRLDGLLGRGLAIAERGAALGAGGLGGYAVISDSTADTFLTCIRDHPLETLSQLISAPAAATIAAHGGGQGVPLTQVGAFLDRLGGALGGLVREGGGALLTGHEALGATRIVGRATGGWVTRLRRLADGAVFDIPSRNLVIATGGEQAQAGAHASLVGGERLDHCGADKIMRSHDVLSLGGLARIGQLLQGVDNPRIVIVGGSTSAVTSANLILKSALGARLGEGGLTLLHRRKLRPFYPSAAAAAEDGYADFGTRDICPLSGFVNRLGGFRTEARDLVLGALGIGGRKPDRRLHTHLLQEGGDRLARQMLDEAHVVIAALGYRPRALPLWDAEGGAIALACAGSGAAPMVDRACRVLDRNADALPGLFGIGLAAGFVPYGPLGGEPSFTGQANGLWLWQNAVGAMIVDQLGTAQNQPAVVRPVRIKAARLAPVPVPGHAMAASAVGVAA